MKEKQKTTKNLGTLIMCASHIGNTQDIPYRTGSSIKEADLLVFEEDKPARRVLKHLKIHKPYLKYNEHAQQETLDKVHEALIHGRTVCYISDQGSPTIADPGRQLLELAYGTGAKVSCIPGPSSISSALSVCPFELDSYFFAGFLPKLETQRKSTLKKLSQQNNVTIILEVPYRMKQLLTSCQQVYDKQRQALLVVDISGENEEMILGSFKDILEKTSHIKKQNFVLIIDKKI